MNISRYKFSYLPYILTFGKSRRTSRNVLTEKPSYFLRITDMDNPMNSGYGEVPVFPGLSVESISEVESILNNYWREGVSAGCDFSSLPSSVVFGLEQAFAQLETAQKGLIFPSDFTDGERSITINGLIWMDSVEKMIKEANDKINQGFLCIKVKIGSVKWQDELQLLKYIRDIGGDDIILRVDANGAFSPNECMWRLEDLYPYNIHSIEQPIRKGNLEELRKICNLSPIPVALDEELIGINIADTRTELLEYVKPHYLILKPALCFGFSGALDWMHRASKLGIGFWVTSALESSVGLDAIAQFTGKYNLEGPQGLGTGNLYTNNLPSPLLLEGDKIRYIGVSRCTYSDIIDSLISEYEESYICS